MFIIAFVSGEMIHEESISKADPEIMIIDSEIYILSAPNNSNETHTFMCLGRAGRLGQH